MKRLLLLALVVPLLGIAPDALAATHTVNQVGFTFQPDSVFIELGDTVEWIFSSGVHTVTNGTGSGDPNAGMLFDAPLNAGNPMFSFTFNSLGDVPYHCTPHQALGMLGNVNVIQPTAAGDGDVENATWSRIKTIYR